MAAIQDGTPPPDGMLVDRASGPRPNASRSSPASSGRPPSGPLPLITMSREDDRDRRGDERHQTEDAHRDPRNPEEAFGPIDRHPRPCRAPDPDNRIAGGD